jgi:hypothetical protein
VGAVVAADVVNRIIFRLSQKYLTENQVIISTSKKRLKIPFVCDFKPVLAEKGKIFSKF